MNDLVTWLRAQLDADTVEIAKHPDDEDPLWLTGSLYATAEENYPCTPYLAISKERALAEVGAKRRILDEYLGQGGDADAAPPGWDGIVKLLALPHADRPGYRPEWGPGAS